MRRQLEDLDRGCVPGVGLDEPRFVIMLDVIDSKQSDQTKCRAQDIAQLTETRHQGRRNEAGADVPPIRKRCSGRTQQLAGHANELSSALLLSEEQRRMARAIEELLKVARLGERNRRVIQVLDETTSCRSDRFDQPGSVAGKPLCVRPGLEVRKPLPAQHFDQTKRIACATQGLGRVAVQSMGSRDSLDPIGMILEWTGVLRRHASCSLIVPMG